MHQYRVTKFDPQYRNSSGAFTRDDWTAISDIGKEVGGTVLTHQHYLRVENAYVEAAIAFLTECQVEALSIVGLENTGGHANSALTLVDGHSASLLEIADITRANLRSLLWCRLESERAFVHVGWDFYMYIGVAMECPQSIDAATRSGLFVEALPSPYFKG